MNELPEVYLNYGKSRFEPIFNPLRWIVNICVFAYMAFYAYKSFSSTSNYFVFTIALMLGWILGDAFTGLIHFFLDNFSFKRIPYLNKAAILFQGHHIDPLGITRHPLSLVMFEPFVLVILYHIILFKFVSDYNFGAPFTVAFTFVSGFSQLSHRLSHSDSRIDVKPYLITKVLRSLYLFVEPKHHSRHHFGDFSRNYAIGSGLTDKLMNHIYPEVKKFIFKFIVRV